MTATATRLGGPAVGAAATTPLAPASAVGALLERGLDQAARLPADALAVIALPAPRAPAAGLWHVDVDADAVLWEPRDDDEAIAGVGTAAEVVATGDDRFARAAADGAAVLARAVAIGDGPAARLFGGLAFVAGGGRDGFGDAWFTWPRWRYTRRGGAAWLSLTVSPAQARERARWHAEHRAAVTALTTALPSPRARVRASHEAPAASWLAYVDEIRAAIDDGEVRKVVAARTRELELAEAADPAAVLIALGLRHPDCTRFGVRRRRVALVGASPERLIRRRGHAIDAEALAGSIARRGDDDELRARLLASAKDRDEHELVVRAIAGTLAPRCAELIVPAVPTVRALRHVLHLHTPIRGTLRGDDHVLALAGALHPTPAVGGTPTAAAIARIAAREPDRGWYAAPVGWFDGDGDGELAVAIRAGVLAGATARLHAGAGIVRDSDARAELAETEVKLRALTGALGLDGGPGDGDGDDRAGDGERGGGAGR